MTQSHRSPSISAIRRRALVGGFVAIAAESLVAPAFAESASAIDRHADDALRRLFASSVKASELSHRARAILIFPRITKAGFMIGGQTGDGVMRVNGASTAYYRIFAASFGLQAGAQTFSFALFFITQSAIDYLNSSDGWAIGSGPSLVVADSGYASTMNTTTLTQDVYAMPFGQQGLMAGLGLEGSRISRIHPDR
ncbi:MAG: YSC84-related protein [Pseudomonadota bacterium]